jgi:hypothetical protein
LAPPERGAARPPVKAPELDSPPPPPGAPHALNAAAPAGAAVEDARGRAWPAAARGRAGGSTAARWALHAGLMAALVCAVALTGDPLPMDAAGAPRSCACASAPAALDRAAAAAGKGSAGAPALLGWARSALGVGRVTRAVPGPAHKEPAAGGKPPAGGAGLSGLGGGGDSWAELCGEAGLGEDADKLWAQPAAVAPSGASGAAALRAVVERLGSAGAEARRAVAGLRAIARDAAGRAGGALAAGVAVGAAGATCSAALLRLGA